MRHRLFQYLVIQFVAETDIILSQVVIHILCHGEIHESAIVSLHMLIDHLLAIADDALDEKGLHF